MTLDEKKLLIKELDLKTIFLFEEAFDESDLPYKVDVLDYCRIDKNFKKIIDENYEVIQTGE